MFDDPDGQRAFPAAMVGRRVAAVSAEGGALDVRFGDGSRLRCPPDPRYEAWELVQNDPGLNVICTPGGELAIFDRTRQPTREEAEEGIRLLNQVTGWEIGDWELTDDGRIIVNPTRETESGCGEDGSPV